MDKSKKQLVKEALLRRATGYDATETVDEYADCEGEIKLVKRKVSTKNVPPDVTAAKILMEEEKDDLPAMTDEQLENEKRRLLASLEKIKGE